MSSERPVTERFLISAPTGADAKNIGAVLSKGGIEPVICVGMADLCLQLAQGAAALIITEEALGNPEQATLANALNLQPPWSDIPILLITTSRTIDWWAVSAMDRLGPRANVILLERPLRGSTVLAAARAVIRARHRQYEVRDLLSERETLLRSLETRVVERTAKLQELVAELEAFSYSVSHDLRAPLRVIAGYARAITDDFGADLEPQVQSYLQRIASTADRMDQLTQDVLAYTRVAGGSIVLEPIDLEHMLRDLLEQYPALSAARDSIRIQYPLEKVQGHPPSLIQALSNLIENALKFVPAGRAARVEIFTGAHGERVRIMIKDNGVGIAPQHHKQIFGIFERLTGRNVPGTGIGLAIVKKAVERMGGSVGLSSTEGTGTVFWIELDRAAATTRN